RGGAIASGGGLSNLRAQPLNLCDERPIVELEQQLALSHQVAFFEAHVRDETGNAWADTDRLHRFKPTGELVPFGHLAGDRRGGSDLWKFRMSGSGLDACTGRDDAEDRHQRRTE